VISADGVEYFRYSSSGHSLAPGLFTMLEAAPVRV
jgi:hypothetical protein